MEITMRVGVTGSTGFIGTALVKVLEDRGDEVIHFVRPSSAKAKGRTIRWDPPRHVLDEGDLAAVGGFDAVVHLAGAGIADKRWSEARKNEILTSRTMSTALLVEALASTKATPVLASGSAIGIYGSRGDEVLTERSVVGDDFLADVCVAWEAAATPLGASGTSVALLRTGIVMGKGGGALARQLPLFRFGLGGQLSTGEQWISPISLHDHVRAILWTIDNKISGPVNLVSPEALTNREFTKLLAQLMKRPALARVPAFALKIVLGPELTTTAVLASQRVEPGILTQTGFSFDDATPRAILQRALVS
jgi:uncharacterized protein (TIGR01777 family)